MSKIIYAVFGDTPRTDRKNIDSIWLDKTNAEGRKQWLDENDEFSDYHIEPLEVDDWDKNLILVDEREEYGKDL